jgi:hypothetical protein
VQRRVARLYHHTLAARDRAQFDACALESAISSTVDAADSKSTTSCIATVKSSSFESESLVMAAPLAASMFIALALNSSLTVLDLCKTKLTNNGLIAVRQAYHFITTTGSLCVDKSFSHCVVSFLNFKSDCVRVAREQISTLSQSTHQ